jgi:hypothetical protein
MISAASNAESDASTFMMSLTITSSTVSDMAFHQFFLDL